MTTHIHGEIMRILLPLAILLAAVLPALSQTATDDPKSAVERVLLTQQDAWNHHDLDAFMAGYWNSPELTFFSGAKESKGWQATLDRYRATYTSAGKEMGHLEFSELQIEPLGTNAAFVRGVWQLTMTDGKTPHGRFTLIFRKFPDGWKIIHDHTSAAD
ncbi:MAG: nuclear transport factor 2 family protein [Candidatus Sulfotelmatobacter sp.]